MGYGAFMHLKNDTAVGLKTYITNSDCVYDHGDEGSNLSLFNDAAIPGNASLPASGNQYIEAKGSGSCFFKTSTFTLKVMTADGTQVCIIKFEDSNQNWDSNTTSGADNVNVYINNTGGGGQATITITVVHAGPTAEQAEISNGDDAFTEPASYQATALDDSDELGKKGTAGQDTQNRRNKGADDSDELGKKGTAGQDTQNRRNKGADDSDELGKKGTAGQDTQNRRNKGNDD